ncbi:hypothetical protein BHM03_00050631, partial [Ensete ventricosum]
EVVQVEVPVNHNTEVMLLSPAKVETEAMLTMEEPEAMVDIMGKRELSQERSVLGGSMAHSALYVT